MTDRGTGGPVGGERHAAPGVDSGRTRWAAGSVEHGVATNFVLRNWLLIAVMAFAGAAAGLFGSAYLQKTYRAEVLLTRVTESGNPLSSLAGPYAGLAGLAGIQLGGNDDNKAATIAMLKSRVFIEAFIADRQLLPVLFADSWDADAKQWRLVEPDAKPPTLQDAYSVFTTDVLSVIEDRETGLITVRVDWRDPEQAALWANALVAQVNEAARKRAVGDADRSLQFLNDELARTDSVEVRQSIYSLMELQISKRMTANTRPDYAFSVIDPAQAPQENRFVRPVPLLLAALGLFAGALLGLIAGTFAPYIVRRASKT